MTTLRFARYDRGVAGGFPISQDAGSDAGQAYDFDRLERAVTGLVERCQALRAENQSLYAKLADRDRRIGALETQVRELNQRRQDVGKRIDELISQLDQLDAQLGASGTAPE